MGLFDPNITWYGRLGADPEIRFTNGGQAVASFSMAVTRSWKSKETDDWQEETSWIRVTAWAELAENAAQSLKKGDFVLVDGTFKTREYENRDGETKTSIEVTATNIAVPLRSVSVEINRIEREKVGRQTRQPTEKAKAKAKAAAPPEDDGYSYGDEEPF